ncbi:MAG: HDOD domain-containing protein [Acidobacteria bacterium]|nr:HDOD domain-containing protein [Acidobacteriota bacterium]
MPTLTPESSTAARPDAGTTPEPTQHWALRELPPFPSIAVKLLQLLSDEEVQVKKLIELLRSDAALSAELLRRANSAMYGARTQVGSLQQGLVLLGFDQVRSLAMAVALGSYVKSAMRIAALRRCWRHSLATALLSERLAKAVNFEADRAYTAGLLHDIGLLGLMVNYPKEYANLLLVSRENNIDLRVTEQAMFDVDHCEAGAWLARQWSFPAEILDSVRRHHDPVDFTNYGLLAITQSSVLLSDALGFGVQPPPDTGLDPAIYDALRKEFPEAAQECLPIRMEVLQDFLTQRINAYE